MMKGEMWLDDWDEKSEKKKDEDEVDGIRQEVYSKGKEMHNKNEWSVIILPWSQHCFCRSFHIQFF